MRLTGGTDRGRTLASPGGRQTRPTSDRVREALFSILGSVEGSRVLDLFAGAGTLGLEALSRGALSVCFMDESFLALKALERSVKELGYGKKCQVFRAACPKGVGLLLRSLETYDLVFLDPPYGSDALEPTLQALAASERLSRGALVVVEHDRDDSVQTAYGRLVKNDERHYGRTVLSFYTNEEE